MQEVEYPASYFEWRLPKRDPGCSRRTVSGVVIDSCDVMSRVCRYVSRGRVRCLVFYRGCHAVLVRIMGRKRMSAVLVITCPSMRLAYALSTNDDKYIDMLVSMMTAARAEALKRSLIMLVSTDKCIDLYNRLSLALASVAEGRKTSLFLSHLKGILDDLERRCSEEHTAMQSRALEARAEA